MTDNRTTELLKEFADQFSDAYPSDNIVSEYAERIEQAIAATLGSERERALEKLVRDMWREITTCPDYPIPPCMTRNICDRIRELGIEVSA